MAQEVMSGINQIIGIYPMGTMNVDLPIKRSMKEKKGGKMNCKKKTNQPNQEDNSIRQNNLTSHKSQYFTKNCVMEKKEKWKDIRGKRCETEKHFYKTQQHLTKQFRTQESIRENTITQK